MRRRRRIQSRPSPIQSFRQIYDKAATIIGLADETDIVADGSDQNPPGFTNNVVPVGAMIYRIRLNITVQGASSSDSGKAGFIVYKLRGGQGGGTDITNYITLGGTATRNQVFWNQALPYGTEDAGPRSFDRWLKIPKTFQRMREGDNFQVKFTNSDASSVSYSLHAEYKFYR